MHQNINLISRRFIYVEIEFDIKETTASCLVPVVLEGCCMDYNEVTSAFSKLVETHFLQRCPLMAGAGTTASATPATGTPTAPVSIAVPTAESFPDCYKVPHLTLVGRGKRQLCGEDGEDQRNAKKVKTDSQASLRYTFNTFAVLLKLK